MLKLMIYIVLTVLGLAFGSFVNALVWRIYQQDFNANRSKKLKSHDLSITKGRSMCTHCHHTLAWYDLLPVVSWLGLSGKCRYCRKRISPQYPVVEVLTSILFVVSYIWWPMILNTPLSATQFVVWLIGLVALIALLVFDKRWSLLPDRLTYPLMGITGVFAGIAVAQASSFTLGVISAVLSASIAGGLFWLLFTLSKGKWIGGGDWKLGVSLGLLLGKPDLALLMLFLASLMGSIFALPQYIKDRRNSQVPFGPFLIIGTLLSFFWGQQMISWYFGLISL